MGGEIDGTSSARLTLVTVEVAVTVFEFSLGTSFELSFVVAETLLDGPIETGNRYLSNDEANGGVGVVVFDK